MKRELRYLQAREMRVAKNADGTRTLSGAVCYNSLSLDLGGFREMIAPGAFAESLDDVLCLRDHDPSLLMGRTKSKTLTLTDTSTELKFSCNLPDTEEARSLAAAVNRGDLDGVSFGFSCMEDTWAVADDEVVRTVIKAGLWEISPCSFAAYPENSVSVRSCPPELRKKMKKRDAACACTCPECQDGDCANCSDENCDCPDCACAQRSAPPTDVSDSDRLKMHMSLELSQRP